MAHLGSSGPGSEGSSDRGTSAKVGGDWAVESAVEFLHVLVGASSFIGQLGF